MKTSKHSFKKVLMKDIFRSLSTGSRSTGSGQGNTNIKVVIKFKKKTVSISEGLKKTHQTTPYSLKWPKSGENMNLP